MKNVLGKSPDICLGLVGFSLTAGVFKEIHIFVGYERIIQSEGILVDLTHPEPGYLENVSMDELSHQKCEDFVPKKYREKCIDISPLPNYR